MLWSLQAGQETRNALPATCAALPRIPASFPGELCGRPEQLTADTAKPARDACFAVWRAPGALPESGVLRTSAGSTARRSAAGISNPAPQTATLIGGAVSPGRTAPHIRGPERGQSAWAVPAPLRFSGPLVRRCRCRRRSAAGAGPQAAANTVGPFPCQPRPRAWRSRVPSAPGLGAAWRWALSPRTVPGRAAGGRAVGAGAGRAQARGGRRRAAVRAGGRSGAERVGG